MLVPCLVLVFLASAPVAAQESEGAPSAERPREAVELFQRARDHYRHGRYSEAADDLERALVLDPGSPTLFFNLARVYELWGQIDRAVRTYELYLQVIPAEDDAERERTEATIVRLQGSREYVRPDEDAYLEPLYVSERGVADELFWVVGATGAAATLTAAVMAIVSTLAHDDARAFVVGRDGGLSERQAQFDGAATLALVTDIVGATGGAALLTAGLLWLLRERTVELYPEVRAASAELRVDRDGFALSLRGAF